MDEYRDSDVRDPDVYVAWGYERKRQERDYGFNEDWEDSKLPEMPWNW